MSESEPPGPITTLSALQDRLPAILPRLVEMLTRTCAAAEVDFETHPAEVHLKIVMEFGGNGRPFKVTLALNEPWREEDDD